MSKAGRPPMVFICAKCGEYMSKKAVRLHKCAKPRIFTGNAKYQGLIGGRCEAYRHCVTDLLDALRGEA